VAREDAPGDKRLVAYLVAENPPSDLVEQLRKLLRAAVPEYMVPSHFVELEGFPLTPNGKVDRKALPAPSESSVVATCGKRRPAQPDRGVTRGHLERVAEAWTRSVSTTTSFELGGHSLLAIRAMTRIRDVFRVICRCRGCFEKPDGGWARGCRTGGQQQLPRRFGESSRASQTGPCPLSFAQEQFWLLHQMVPPGSPVYNIVDNHRDQRDLPCVCAEKRARRAVRRHEILRTAFVLPDGQLRQMVSPASDLALPEARPDFLAGIAAERTNGPSSCVSKGRRQFDLSQPRFFRATDSPFIRNASTGCSWSFTHIVAGRMAMRIIQDEVKQLYAAFSQQRPSPLAELPVQYADFACWQRDWFQETSWRSKSRTGRRSWREPRLC